jgi:hypothetical protein
VQAGAGERSGFSLAFKVSNKSILHTLLLLLPAQVPWLRTIVIMTVNGMPHVLMDGVITRQEMAPGAAGSDSTITLTGEDLTVVMDQQQLNGVPYPAMPPEARVAMIVAKYAVYGMVPLVIPSLFTDVPIPTDRIPSHEGTDLGYINQLATEAGHVFYVEPGPAPGMNVAYWGPEIKIGIPQKALNADMDHPLNNVESIRFDFDNIRKELPVVFIQNQQTRVPIPIPIPDVSILNPPLGAVAPQPRKITLMTDTAKLSPMAALSRGLAAASRSSDSVSGSGSLDVVRYGHVLKPRGLVGVRGAGPAFDGLYYVKRVTSTVKRGEFKQSFELTRNGLVSIAPLVPA